MTGIFFISGIKTNLNSHTLLKLSIYIGLLGLTCGFLGFFTSQLEILAGLSLGLSTSWLPMANATINYYKQKNDLISPINFINYSIYITTN